MPSRPLVESAKDFAAFDRIRLDGRTLPFAPLPLIHVYIKLDFKSQYDNAKNPEDARGFLRSVARASIASHQVATSMGGYLMEVQGSLLHVGIPATSTIDSPAVTKTFAGTLHAALTAIFNNTGSRVEGWRMAADTGFTMVVAGRGVHGDNSFVSLGPSANRPAKHLFSELERPESRRALKRFTLGMRDTSKGKWDYSSLDSLVGTANTIAEALREATRSDLPLRYELTQREARTVLADAAPIAPAGHPASPQPDKPTTYFGWVTRADLDGFTARVEECCEDVSQLTDLAQDFYAIMDAAAAFVASHRETLAQLPWAGDNFTAAAVFESKAAYERASASRPVDLTLDFEKEMAEAATSSGFGGWAHGVAGGAVQFNSPGNVYLAGVEVGGRRFLVGAGEGFGRSTQAFGDVNPKPGAIVLYESDWSRLEDRYRRAFEPAVTVSGTQSTLFRTGSVNSLLRLRAEQATSPRTTAVSFAAASSSLVSSRPFAE